MAPASQIAIDRKAPPFDRFKHIERLSSDRSGHASVEHVRHQLYVARDRKRPEQVLIKVTSKPGLVYERNLANEIATLSTIGRELPDSPYFPALRDHGRLPDGRIYVVMSLFEEFPLAASIGPERVPARLVAHLRTALEVARALGELHGLGIFHVDLNPMNILYRSEGGRPIVRLVDFESSYEVARHARGEFYDPPTTTAYCAPEVARRGPDARADVFSLGAVLYTMLAGFDWTWREKIGPTVAGDTEMDPELRDVLLTAASDEPDGRYSSMAAFGEALGGYLETIWPGRSW